MLAGVGLAIGLLVIVPVLAFWNGVEIPLTGELSKSTEILGMEPVLKLTLHASNPIGSSLTIIVVALAAALYPAVKASRAHPVDALRSL